MEESPILIGKDWGFWDRQHLVNICGIAYVYLAPNRLRGCIEKQTQDPRRDTTNSRVSWEGFPEEIVLEVTI